MLKIKTMLFLTLFALSQNLFASQDYNTKVKFCNDPASSEYASIGIYGETSLYGSLEAAPGQCLDEKMTLPNLIEIRVFYGYQIAPKYARLSNATHLIVKHQNTRQKDGKLAETTSIDVW